MAFEHVKSGMRLVVKYLFFYFTLLNVYLLFTYAFKDTIYTFSETLQYHFSFYYLYFILPLALAILVGNRLLYTEYPKLIYVVMPLVAMLPFALIPPSRCSFVSCDQTIYYALLVIVLVLSIKKSFDVAKETGEYMEFASEERMRHIFRITGVLLNIIVFVSLPFLNNVHARNDEVITNLPNVAPSALSEECSKIMFNFHKKSLCLNEVAVTTNDEGVCKRIRRMVVANENADSCYRKLAVLNDNIEFCNSIFSDDIRYGCFEDFSPLTEKICEKIEDVSYRRGCLKDCSMVTDVAARDSCFVSTSLEDMTNDGCAAIVNNKTKDHCYDNLIPVVDACTTITSAAHREMCFLAKAKLEKDPQFCEPMVDVGMRDKCLSLYSMEVTDCSNITSPRIKELCQANFATDIGECEQYTVQLSMDNCFRSVAVHTKDFKICNKIEDLSVKTLCENTFE